MTLLIEAEVSDKDITELKKMGYDPNFPFSVNVTLDYGDKVIYSYGSVFREEFQDTKEFQELDT